LKKKPKGPHFDSVDVTMAESQTMLNTIREHDFQDAFTKWQMCPERCICEEGDYFKGDGGQ
jgi:hypothetical protein